MVATRKKSLNAPSSPPPSDDTDISNKRTKSALKKLAIDAHGTLIGETKPVEEEKKEVYHFRGAVYEYTVGTKPEWVDSQPKRWKRQAEVGVGVEVVDGDETEDAQKSLPTEKEKEKEKTTTQKQPLGEKKIPDSAAGTNRARNEDHKEAITTTAGSKRARSIEHKAPATTAAGTKRARSEEREDEHSTDQPSAKRAKRNTPKKYYGRPKRTPTSTPRKPKPKPKKPSKEQEEETPLNTSLAYDMATVGGHDEKSCIEQARERARAQGFAVDPLGEEEVRRMREQQTVRNIVDLMGYNKRIEALRRSKEEVGVKLEAVRVENKKRKRDAQTEGTVSDERRKRKRVDSAGVLEDVPVGSSDGTPQAGAEVEVDATTPAPAARHVEGTQELTPRSNNSAASQVSSEVSDDVQIVTSPPRQITPASSTPAAPVTQQTLDTPRFPSLETTNKNGDKVRWSLPANLTDTDRAEEQIYRGRMDGESRQARRRRVKREMERIRSWEEVDDGEGGGVAALELVVEEVG